MAQEKGVNIMSVELAIKRELAYRQKLAGLAPDDDSIKHFLPLEVPTSAKTSGPNPPCQKPSSAIIPSPNLSSTDVLGPSSISAVSHQFLFPNASCQKLSSTPRGGPGPCPVSDLTKVASHQVPPSMASLIPLQFENQDLSHSPWPNPNVAPTDSSIMDKGTASSFQYHPHQHPQPFHIGDSTNLFCKVCKVTCTGTFNYKEHVSGHKHQAKLKMQQWSSNSRGTSKLQQPRCNLCQIWCPDENSLKLHLDGQKHKAKLQKIELIKKGIAPKKLCCDLCQVSCIDEDSLRMHLKGKSHFANLHARGKKNSRAR